MFISKINKKYPFSHFPFTFNSLLLNPFPKPPLFLSKTLALYYGHKISINSTTFTTIYHTTDYPFSQNASFMQNKSQNSTSFSTKCDTDYPFSQNAFLVENKSQNAFSVENTSQNASLVENYSQNSINSSTKCDTDYPFSQNAYLVESKSQNAFSVENKWQNASLVENYSQNSINSSAKCDTDYPFSQNAFLVENKPENAFLVENKSQNTFLVENKSQNLTNITTNCDAENKNLDSYKTDADKVCEVINENYANFEKNISKLGIQVTTKLVIEVLHKLRYEEKSAFRFFTWAGNQEFYSHEPQVYNEMIDILTSTKYKVKQFGILCELLDYMKRNDKKRLVPIEVLLNILRKYTEKHLTYLRKFAKKKRINLKICKELDAFNLLLDAFCKCCLVEEAEMMFNKVKKRVEPDVHTYNILFFGWCRVRNPTKAMSVLDDMIKMGFTPESFTYNTAIDTFCREGMVSEAIELLEFMKKKGSVMSSPTAKTYCVVIVALSKCDRVYECFEYLEDMMSSGCLPDVSTYKELIEGMCCAGKIEVAYKLLEIMGKKGYPPDVVTYNCFLEVLCDLKDGQEAMKLYGKMVKEGCKPSVHTFNMLISMFFEMGEFDGAFETWDEMDKRGCARDTITSCLMIEGLFGCGKAQDACLLLEDVVNNGMKLPYEKFNLFMQKLAEIGELQAIHRLSEHARKFYNPAMARRFSLNQKRRSMSLRGK